MYIYNFRKAGCGCAGSKGKIAMNHGRKIGTGISAKIFENTGAGIANAKGTDTLRNLKLEKPKHKYISF